MQQIKLTEKMLAQLRHGLLLQMQKLRETLRDKYLCVNDDVEDVLEEELHDCRAAWKALENKPEESGFIDMREGRYYQGRE